MQTVDALSTFRLLRWQARNIAIFMGLSIAVVVGEELSGKLAGVLPQTPITVLGAAIGIYASFRTNSAYDRWWEGRKLWGQLVNTSRHFTSEALAYVGDGPARVFVLRQILYVHALRCELRGEEVHADLDVVRVNKELTATEEVRLPSLCTRILRRQLMELSKLADADKLDARRMQSFDQTLATLLDVQGGCERIRNTPFPPSYGRITELLIRTYAVLLPLAIINDLEWWSIPVSIVVCLAFKLISEVGAVLEDPFTHAWDALPLHALSRTIERNLRDALGDSMPPPAEPDRRGVLL
ncbi:MAG TPA: bestrophin family ion channel [Polyangiales bacterium]|nr:bestrophin family ion channel [Polyangiales bacterium]